MKYQSKQYRKPPCSASPCGIRYYCRWAEQHPLLSHNSSFFFRLPSAKTNHYKRKDVGESPDQHIKTGNWLKIRKLMHVNKSKRIPLEGYAWVIFLEKNSWDSFYANYWGHIQRTAMRRCVRALESREARVVTPAMRAAMTGPIYSLRENGAQHGGHGFHLSPSTYRE